MGPHNRLRQMTNRALAVLHCTNDTSVSPLPAAVDAGLDEVEIGEKGEVSYVFGHPHDALIRINLLDMVWTCCNLAYCASPVVKLYAAMALFVVALDWTLLTLGISRGTDQPEMEAAVPRCSIAQSAEFNPTEPRKPRSIRMPTVRHQKVFTRSELLLSRGP